MKKLLLMSMMMVITTFAYAEENFYCPSEIYCGRDPETNRVRCLSEKIYPEIWLEPNGAMLGTLSLSYIDFGKGINGNTHNYGYRCVYVQGEYGTVIEQKVEYTLVPDMKKGSRWVKTKSRTGHDAECGSYSSPVYSSEDCPFKIEPSLAIYTNLDPKLGGISIKIDEVFRLLIPHGRISYPEKPTIKAYRLESYQVKQICQTDSICELDISFQYGKIRYKKGGSVWVDMGNYMNIMDIRQPEDTSFKILKVGSNALELRRVK